MTHTTHDVGPPVDFGEDGVFKPLVLKTAVAGGREPDDEERVLPVDDSHGGGRSDKTEAGLQSCAGIEDRGRRRGGVLEFLEPRHLLRLDPWQAANKSRHRRQDHQNLQRGPPHAVCLSSSGCGHQTRKVRKKKTRKNYKKLRRNWRAKKVGRSSDAAVELAAARTGPDPEPVVGDHAGDDDQRQHAHQHPPDRQTGLQSAVVLGCRRPTSTSLVRVRSCVCGSACAMVRVRAKR